MNATDKDLNVQKVLKTTEKIFPSTSKALGNVDRAFDTTKRMKTSYDADSRVLMSVTFKCARSGCHESSGEAKQRRSKKVGCNYELVCTIKRDQPDVVHYEERHGHSGHVPGSTEDLKYLSLHPDIVKLAKEYYINAGISPQQILYALQANRKVNAITDGKVSRHFLPSLKDIQNIVKQLKTPRTSSAYAGCLRSASVPLGLPAASLSHTVHLGAVSLPAGGVNHSKKSLAGYLCASQRAALEENKQPSQSGRDGLFIYSFTLSTDVLVMLATGGIAAGLGGLGWLGKALSGKIDGVTDTINTRVDDLDKRVDERANDANRKLDDIVATVHRLEVKTVTDQAALESRTKCEHLLSNVGKISSDP